MSNFATVAQLRRATSQLPVSWYCDPEIYAAEQENLFPRAPSYVGHELMAPNVGDYCALESRGNAQALVRNAGGIELISNICRHRQAIMLNGRGNNANIEHLTSRRGSGTQVLRVGSLFIQTFNNKAAPS